MGKNQKTKSTLLYQFLKLVKVKNFYFFIFVRFHAFFGGSICSHFFLQSFLKTRQKNHEIGQKSQKYIFFYSDQLLKLI